MKIDGILTKEITISISPKSAIDALFKNYFKSDKIHVVEKEDGIYSEYDTSVHGSPIYEYNLITNDSKLVAVYHHLIDLYNLIENIENN